MQGSLRNTVTRACAHTSAHIITGQQGAVRLGPEKVVCERNYTALADLLMAIGLTCCKEKRAFFAESCDVITKGTKWLIFRPPISATSTGTRVREIECESARRAYSCATL
jgi:hypothetical protein